MSSLKGKRILIIQQRGWGKVIGRFLARKLFSEDCRLAALTSKKSVHELIVNQNKTGDAKYDIIESHDGIMEDPEGYLKGNRFPLQKICDELGVNSVWRFIYASRMHTKCYRDKYYYGFKQNIPDEGIILYIQAVYKSIKKFFDEFKPDAIISPNFVSTHHIMLYHYAKKRGVPMFAVTDSKIQGAYIFTYSYLDNEGSFYERIDELNSGKTDSGNREKARQYIKEFRESFKKPDYFDKKDTLTKPLWRQIWLKIKKELSPWKQAIFWFFKKPENAMKNIGATIDNKSPRIILRDHFRNKLYRRFMKKFRYYPLPEKYVYFPLQFQPEASIDVAAPYASNQIETARQIAMSLPGDYTLVVKEHPGMVGLRPPSYIEKVARTPNVKLVDYRLPSKTVIEGADLIISPNSTTLAEAAFYGKSAIQLGDLGTTLKLPNVVKHSDISTVGKKITEMISKVNEGTHYEKPLENYVAAVFDTCLPFDYLGLWEKGRRDEWEHLWSAYKKELLAIFEKQQQNKNGIGKN